MGYTVPRPKRSDFMRRAIGGRWFDQTAYDIAVRDWQEKKSDHLATERAARDAARGSRSGWQRQGGKVDGRPAVTRVSGDRVEALWGGRNPEGDGAGHGHIVTNDGVNAAHVQYPNEGEAAMNDPDDKRSR